jgi:hypothetical protein
MKKNITTWFFLGMAAILLAACTKNNDNYFYNDQLFPLTIKGYNGSGEQLIVKIDTNTLPLPINAQSSFSIAQSFLFKGEQQTLKLHVSEKSTGKVVLEKEFKKEDSIAYLNILYMDGKVSNMPEKPAIANDKISLIYMFIPNVTNYSQPVDFAIGKYYATPAVFEELARIKNVKPNEFTEAVTIPTFSVARQEYNGVLTNVSFHVRIFKAGTNTPYTDGSSYVWNNLTSTAPKPAASTASSKLYIFSELPSGTQMRFNTRLDN